jgi:hypothetical protein
MACAPPLRTEPIWLHLASTAEGTEFRVNAEVVERERLGPVLLEHALRANPSLTEEQALREVRCIYVRAEPHSDYQMVTEVV